MGADAAYDLLNALMVGVLLGGFYASVSVGLTIAFGLLDVPHIAHPSFVVLGGYGAIVFAAVGIDPLITTLALAPVFYGVGWLLFRFYHTTFESRSKEAAMLGLIFFFGTAFVIEAAASFAFGTDLYALTVRYLGSSLRMGEFRIPWRIVIAGVMGVLLLAAIAVFLGRTFLGRAIKAVAQDPVALELCGADSTRIKRLAFSLASATAPVAGALLAIISPIEPFLGRVYLGKAFTIAILAGAGSIKGTLVAALALGIIESLVLATAGTAWTPAVAFALLLVVLVVRPQGIFGR